MSSIRSETSSSTPSAEDIKFRRMTTSILILYLLYTAVIAFVPGWLSEVYDEAFKMLPKTVSSIVVSNMNVMEMNGLTEYSVIIRNIMISNYSAILATSVMYSVYTWLCSDRMSLFSQRKRYTLIGGVVMVFVGYLYTLRNDVLGGSNHDFFGALHPPVGFFVMAGCALGVSCGVSLVIGVFVRILTDYSASMR